MLAADADGRGNTIANHLAPHFRFSVDTGSTIDNDWLHCAGFTVSRIGDAVTPEIQDAQ